MANNSTKGISRSLNSALYRGPQARVSGCSGARKEPQWVYHGWHNAVWASCAAQLGFCRARSPRRWVLTQLPSRAGHLGNAALSV